MPPELKKLFEELEQLSNLAEIEVKALSDEFGRRMQALASKAGTKGGADWQRLFDEETAGFEKRLAARLERLRSDTEAKLGPINLTPHRPQPFGLDRMQRRKPLNRPRRKPPGRTPDAGGVPVKPNRPSGLTGGAAAELEQD